MLAPRGRGACRLPDDQRVALVLCVFGDHLYTQVADFMELPAEEVARLLREAMQTLGQPHERVDS